MAKAWLGHLIGLLFLFQYTRTGGGSTYWQRSNTSITDGIQPPFGLWVLGCVHTKFDTATKLQCFPIHFQWDPLKKNWGVKQIMWSSCNGCWRILQRLSSRTCLALHCPHDAAAASPNLNNLYTANNITQRNLLSLTNLNPPIAPYIVFYLMFFCFYRFLLLLWIHAIQLLSQSTG